MPFLDSCYKIITDTKTWEGSALDCESAGAHLVKFTSQEEVDYLHNTFLLPLGSGSVWIGLNLKNDSFYWTDNTKLNYSNWNDGEPNNYGGNNEDCVEMYVSNGRWNDLPCNYEKAYACERGMLIAHNYIKEIILISYCNLSV